MAGAPKGNTNASKENRLWGNTIRRAVMQGENETHATGEANKLRQLADKLIENGLGGDNIALKEIGDRLDGRAVQSIEANVQAEIVEIPYLTPKPDDE